MNIILFKRITEQGSFTGALLAGLSSLWQSGVFDILRDIGRTPPIPPESPNYTQLQATMYAWSLGYNQALDDLYYFKEKFLDTSTKQSVSPDYGGLAEALRKGDLTQEEIDGLRSNTYSSDGNTGTD